jgi:1,4-alpha-glucan branching enzyme
MVLTTHTGECEFRMYLPHASYVELVGDFTGWQDRPVTMHRDADGFWNVRLRLPEGEHSFSYLVDGRTWMPDYAASGVARNPFGNWTSRLVVERVHAIAG